MRLHRFITSGAVLGALAASAVAPAVAATPAGVQPTYVCASQAPNGGQPVLTQEFTNPGLATASNVAADDFIMSSSCIVGSITIPVAYTGNTAAVPVTWTFRIYDDQPGSPGSTIASSAVNTTTTSGSGTATVTASFPGVSLPANVRFWVSAQAKVSADKHKAYWGTANIQNLPAMWENPGGGFGVGCTTWTVISSCLGITDDLAFTLLSGSAGTPVPCYSQLNGPYGPALGSQVAVPGSYTDIGADDLQVPQSCKVKSVDIPGRYLNSGQVQSVKVTFHTGSLTGPSVTRTVSWLTPYYTDTAGWLHVPFASTVGLSSTQVYWITVQVTVAGNAPKIWGWETRSQVFTPAQWENPGGALSSCTTYQPLSCAGSPDPDFAFSVNTTI